MSLATNNARTAIIELLDGTLPSDFVDAGLFAHGVFDGQPTQAQKAMAVQTALATHRFDVQFTANVDHGSAVSRVGNKRLVTLGVTIPMWTHVATPAQETDRNAVMADIGADMAAAMRGLGYPHALAETDAGGTTNIVGGLLHGPNGDGFPRWRVTNADWSAQIIQSQIVGSIILDATTPDLVPMDVITSVNTVLWLAPGSFAYNTHAAWEDQSDYTNHFTASGDARPTLIADWLDGNPGVQFDGASQYLYRSVMRGIGESSAPCVIVVCDVDDTQPEPAPTVFLMDGDTASRAPFVLEHTATTAKVYTYLGPSMTDTRASGSAGTTAPRWVLAKSSNADGKPEVYVNGALKGIAAAGVAGGIFETVTRMTIGGGTVDSDPTNRWFAGVIGEIIVFDGVPTPAEFTDLFVSVMAPRWPSLSWSLP